MNNPNFLAFLAALGFGLMLIPWNRTLQNMGNPQFLVIIGVMYVIIGLAQQSLQNGKTNFAIGPMTLAVFATLIYIFAITSFNFAVAAPGAKLGVIAAITATYPAIATISAVIFEKQAPTLQELSLITLTIVGVVGLSLIGKSH